MMPHPQAQPLNWADRVFASVERHGLYPARMDEIARGRAIAADLIGPDIAIEQAFEAVHARTGAGVFVYRQEGVAQGFLGVILLRASGLAKIEDDSFNALDPNLRDVCEAGEAPAAVYAWGFAAATRLASGAVVLGLMSLRDRGLPHVPFFCRAATPEGERVILGKMGYAPFPPSKTAILFKPADPPSMECAA